MPLGLPGMLAGAPALPLLAAGAAPPGAAEAVGLPIGMAAGVPEEAGVGFIAAGVLGIAAGVPLAGVLLGSMELSVAAGVLDTGVSPLQAAQRSSSCASHGV
ncbi:MAG TPA: hypothetical protein VJR89_19790 [Polyangiales bacterium]|nr:hypothetical protein [Polyangiales bacterium]